MTTKPQELESLGTEFGAHEAGVAELMEFYEKVEGIYVEASAFMSEDNDNDNYISDSTNLVKTDADLGRNTDRV